MLREFRNMEQSYDAVREGMRVTEVAVGCGKMTLTVSPPSGMGRALILA
jgi:ubiquinone/menaquinone biosynthesis C-methylase UbiE